MEAIEYLDYECFKSTLINNFSQIVENLKIEENTGVFTIHKLVYIRYSEKKSIRNRLYSQVMRIYVNLDSNKKLVLLNDVRNFLFQGLILNASYSQKEIVECAKSLNDCIVNTV